MAGIGVFLSIAQNDADLPRRQQALLAGLAQQSITPVNTNVIYAYGFDNNGNQQVYDKIAQGLVTSVSAGGGPSALFGSCWPTMNALSNNTSTIPIIYAGLFHDDAETSNPNSFANNVGGYYSHDFDDICAQWVDLIIGGVTNLGYVGLVFDNGGGNPGVPGSNYHKHIHELLNEQNIDDTHIRDIDINGNYTTHLTNFANHDPGVPHAVIVTPSQLLASKRLAIIELINSLGLPAVYPNRMYVNISTPNNGLVSYGAVLTDQYWNAGDALGQAYNGAALTPFATLNTNFETVVSQSQATARNFTIPSGAIVVPQAGPAHSWKKPLSQTESEPPGIILNDHCPRRGSRASIDARADKGKIIETPYCLQARCDPLPALRLIADLRRGF